jgi:lysosomal alpha-mannosidase
LTWPTKTDDFFPYASDPHTYWTGYFTSRPTSKRFERVGNQFLQICKALSSKLKIRGDEDEENLGKLRRVMGVMQHHDAITGTEKQHVANDYHRELHLAIKACESNTRSALNQFVTGKNSTDSAQFEFKFESCLNLNISSCEIPERSEKFVVTVYNPLAHSTSQYTRFPVGGSEYEVHDAENSLIKSQLVPIPTSLSNLHYRESFTTQELVFQASEVSAIGYKSYYVTRIKTSSETQPIEIVKESVTIGSDDLKITFGANGLLSDITLDGTTSELLQNFVVYKGAMDNVRSSGAYIFRPNPEVAEEVIANDVTISVVRGEHVDEVHQKFNEWISQVVRIYKTEKFIEFEWLVGSIPIDDNVGKEIVSRFYTKIISEGEFFTDSNGREMMKRKRNHRETWELDVQEPVAGNYYPVNTKIAIEDENYRLAVLTDRVQGGSSMIDGSVELMVSFKF